MSRASLESFGGEFALRVRQMLPERTNEQEDLLIDPASGLTFLRLASGNYKPLGCPACLLGEYGQNEWGEPTLDGRRLLDFEEIWKYGPHAYGPEITANTWACPHCRLPLSNMLPNFAGRREALTLEDLK